MKKKITDPEALNTAQKIRTARRLANLTMQQLGEKVGVSRQAISLYELGYTRPGPDVLDRLCGVLGLNYYEHDHQS